MARFMAALKQVAPWAAQNADGAIALALAIVVGVLGIMPEEMFAADPERAPRSRPSSSAPPRW